MLPVARLTYNAAPNLPGIGRLTNPLRMNNAGQFLLSTSLQPLNQPETRFGLILQSIPVSHCTPRPYQSRLIQFLRVSFQKKSLHFRAIVAAIGRTLQGFIFPSVFCQTRFNCKDTYFLDSGNSNDKFCVGAIAFRISSIRVSFAISDTTG